jgi:hypothetical protein
MIRGSRPKDYLSHETNKWISEANTIYLYPMPTQQKCYNLATTN